ncbi:LOW QUALITY PROTEIN: hypothetical protein CVT26_003471 [Gymnopilus dilepis]|uniref:SWIM-type domain-containing protein n=1 Tax=Gymnopilus dilepis TaxID=231916 RepID=A0A409Y5G6_9AGAR|nr:LOW QUALITY PROTEIN: hypothetical protein CVT26_003471 [Gymnopilus dilepis]
MGFEDLLSFAEAVLEYVRPVPEEVLIKLFAIFPHTLVIAALDVIDRKNGKFPAESRVYLQLYTTAWGHTEFEVIGSIATYSVLLDIKGSSMPYSCSCPAFIYSVMNAHHGRCYSNLTARCCLAELSKCKHVLAAHLARKMNVCILRQTNVDDLAALFLRQFPMPAKPQG